MTMLGSGCFVGWYDLAPGREADHDEWHTHEHMIERVAIPGFLRGSRYRGAADTPRVCVVYQGENIGTFTSPAYLERLNAPTPWSQKSLPLFVGMNRTLCTVAASFGHGRGGHLLTVQMSSARADEDPVPATLLADMAARRGLCGAHDLIGEHAASTLQTEEKKLRATPDAVADRVILIEGYDGEAITEARSELLERLREKGLAARAVAGRYTLDFSIDEDEAKRLWTPHET